VALLSPASGLPIYLDNEKILYVVPRKDAIIVGGTYEENVAEEITEQDAINKILANAYEAMPSLKQQQVTGSWAGLRPYRKEVRLESDADTKIIHNYGHGGSGFTLAFGCAQNVVDLIDQG
jgi:D-amino-acid oxidase